MGRDSHRGVNAWADLPGQLGLAAAVIVGLVALFVVAAIVLLLLAWLFPRR